MKEFEYVIKTECGLHARPAGLLVKEAKQFQSAVTVSKDNATADATKLFAVMGLGAKEKDRVRIKIDGPDEIAAASQLKNFFEKNL